MECKVIQTLEYGNHDVFIGEIVQSYAKEEVLTHDRVDFAKVKPIIYELSGRYWALGQTLGKCWDVGKQLKR
jgi:flavin reductase (DIM6/NTAB) family NADH-FMN oxidoreductase RutF